MPIIKGNIVLVSLDPSKGSEYSKTRPAIIVSNDVCNLYAPVVTIVPCTSKTDKIFKTEVLIPVSDALPEKSKACGDQIRTIDKSRIVKVLGLVSAETMKKIEAAIMLHLDIRI